LGCVLEKLPLLQNKTTMNRLLIIGAGRSATALIKYALDKAANLGWHVVVADADLDLATRKVGGHPNGQAVWLDANKPNDRQDLVSRADVIISLLPPYLHYEVAVECVKQKKHLITASYLSEQMIGLRDKVEAEQLIFMGEMGLDPGIDHMSAMQQIHRIQNAGGKLTAFRSYTGGLVAPESDDHPWHYKITWNPRNVVTAGQGTAQYLKDGELKYLPYHRLFSNYELVDIPGMGQYEMYPNRDSLLYREIYGLANIPTLLRGTLRARGYCDAWNALVQIGLTDTQFPIVESENLTYFDLLDAYTEGDKGTLRERVAIMLKLSPDNEILDKLEWLGLFRKKKIGLSNATPALILEQLLLEKWSPKPHDKDMVIMQHEFEFKKGRKKYLHISTMVMKGHDNQDTSMSRLVGLPLGIFARHVLQGNITKTGVHIPVMAEVYEPVLAELAEYGVVFKEVTREV
jgi:saccharopine dehydrogenase-like NADP-dependent oxidoreductase